MLPASDMMIARLPPPQAVVDQQWLWHILLMLLGSCSVLRFLGLDIAGALLSGLMLGIAAVMMKNGMTEMGKNTVMFSVLSALNFLLDIFPLIVDLSGHISWQMQPIQAATSPDGTSKVQYTITTLATPFFDSAKGFHYNIQSLAMVTSPATMALGIYLSISAHNEIRAQAQMLLDEGMADLNNLISPEGAGSLAAAVSAVQQPDSGQQNGHIDSFQGQSHKLSAPGK